MPAYGQPSYWDERYAADDGTYDWYCSLTLLVDFLLPLLRPDHRILMLGCGNSELSAELHSAGFPLIVNVDISDHCIRKMADRHQALEPPMEWRVMDCRELTYPDADFDVVIDKGTMDALLCGDGSYDNVYRTHCEVQRVLRPGGRCVTVTYGEPKLRLEIFQRRKLHWQVTHYTLPRPYRGPDNEESSSYHVYVLTKPLEDPLPATNEEDEDEFYERVLGMGGGTGPLSKDVSVADLPMLIPLLRGDDLEQASRAATVVLGLTLEEQTLGDVVRSGAIAPLVGLLGSGPPESRAIAAAAVANLALHADGAGDLVAAGVIGPLVALLSNGTVAATDHAAAALANLTAGEAYFPIVGEAGGIPPLVHLLTVGSPEAQAAAAGTLWNLSTHPEAAGLIAGTGAVPTLLALLAAGSPDIQISAAGILQSVAGVGPDHRATIIDGGAIPMLAALLTSDSTDAQAAAAGALALLADGDPDGARAVVASGAVPRLVALLSSSHPLVQQNAAVALGHLVGHQEVRAAVDACPLLALSGTALHPDAANALELLAALLLLGQKPKAPAEGATAAAAERWSDEDPCSASDVPSDDEGSTSPPAKRCRVDTDTESVTDPLPGPTAALS